MNVELTDLKRYELEKEGLISLLLHSARNQTPISETDISFTLNIDSETTTRLITALRNDQIIK